MTSRKTAAKETTWDMVQIKKLLQTLNSCCKFSKRVAAKLKKRMLLPIKRSKEFYIFEREAVRPGLNVAFYMPRI